MITMHVLDTILRSFQKYKNISLPDGYYIFYDMGIYELRYHAVTIFRSYNFLQSCSKMVYDLQFHQDSFGFKNFIENEHGIVLESENLEENKFAISLLGDTCSIHQNVLEYSYMLNKIHTNQQFPDDVHHLIVVYDTFFCEKFAELL